MGQAIRLSIPRYIQRTVTTQNPGPALHTTPASTINISDRDTHEDRKFATLQQCINATERNYHRGLKALENLPPAPNRTASQDEAIPPNHQ